jgi:Spy/CpxP family protein refolding chaperone
MTRRRLCSTLLCFVLALAPAFAQNRSNFAWWNSPVAAEICGLTPAQTQKIRQIVRSYRARLLDARNNTQKAELDLEDIFNDTEVNTQAAQPVIERVAAARAASSRVFLEMSVDVRNVLTIDQWRTLVKRWDELQKKKPGPDTQTPPE